MKRLKIMAALLLLALLLAGCANYRPGGGNCTVTGKRQFFGIYQVYVDAYAENGWSQRGFRLDCTQEQYDQLEIGDTVYCDWEFQGNGDRGRLQFFRAAAEPEA